MPRRRGRRSIGPVAIEADDTPFDTPGGPDDAGVFGDRIVDPARSAVINMNFADAEPPRNCRVMPGHEGLLTDVFPGDDFQLRVPIFALLLGKSRLNARQNLVILTQRHFGGIFGPRQPEILLEPVRR